jgi:hypothetical protein
VASALKTWRRDRRETGFWKKARDRSASLREAEIVNEVDVALMSMGQALSRYRQTGGNREFQLDQLYETRLHLEACLGMLENVLPEG